MFSTQAQSFPVLQHQQEIEHSFETLPAGGCLVIHAEPGSGKTSLVPAMIAAQNPGIVLVTEPRRLAAVNAAKFASTLLDTNQLKSDCISPRGLEGFQISPNEIGYVVRGERNLGSATRVVYATEGMALVLLADPQFVSKLACVVVDEFHERHATTDALLLVLRLWSKQIAANSQSPGIRKDRLGPKFVLMSATFSEERYAALFDHQSLLRVPGQLFPVEILYLDPNTGATGNHGFSASETPSRQGLHRPGDTFSEFVGEAIHLELRSILEKSLKQTDPILPHILVFLPGKGEIVRVKKVLEVLLCNMAAALQLARVSLRVDELHGELPLQKMMQSLEPVQAEDRKIKIFLATNIAESSLTLPGVRVVIDSGLKRYARHHLGSGALELGTAKISQNSANQRAGRAGREGPGKVIRLFSESDYLRRAPELTPEICESDLSRDFLEILRVLTSLKLDLPQNITQWLALPWVDAPPEPRLAQAVFILSDTQAIDECGRLTEKGRAMAAIPLPVRLGAVVIETRKLAPWISKVSSIRPLVFELLVASLCCVVAEGDIYLHETAEHIDSLTLQLQAFLAKLSNTSHFGCFSFKADHYDQRAWNRVLECLHSICGKDFSEFCRTLKGDLSLVEAWKSDKLSEELELILGRCFFAGYFDAVARQSDRRSLEHMNGETFYVLHDLPGSGHGAYFLVLDGLRFHTNARTQIPYSKGAGNQSQARKIASKILSLPHEILFEGPDHLIEERTEVNEEHNRLQVSVSVYYGKLRIETETLCESDARLKPALSIWVSETLLPRLFESPDVQALLMRLQCTKGKNSLALLQELNEINDSSPIVSRLFDFLNSNCRLSSKSIELSIQKICASENLEKWLFDFATGRELVQLAPANLQLENGKNVKVEYQWCTFKGTREDKAIEALGKANQKDLGNHVQVRLVGRIQDFYGVKGHPQIGCIPKEWIAVELLAPGGQTAQITADLGQFWKASYPEVKKAYLGNYPKHYWPEDPATAKPFLTKRQEQSSRQ